MPASPLERLRESGAALREQEPMSRHTSLAIGGPADWYAEVSTLDQLAALRRFAVAEKCPVFFLGAGSNLLVSDRGIRGLVIHLNGDFRKVRFDGTRAEAGAGLWMPTLARQCAERGLAGVESLIGVPGTVGGGLVMNAGTREGVLGDVVETVHSLAENGELESLSRDRIQFAYRSSSLAGRWLTGAVLQLKAEDPRSIMSRVETLLRYRSETQPIGTSNCGSVFKNPPGDSAARLVEAAGLKGRRSGDAQVSPKHANFIVNHGAASAADVRSLIEFIQKTVLDRSGVRLDPEIKCAGEWDSPAAA